MTAVIRPESTRSPAEPTLHRLGARVAPLSFAQQRLWLIDVGAPGSATYNVPLLMRWLEPVDLACLRAALTQVVSRHEVLRTTYELRGDRPVQVVRDPAPVEIEVIDLDGVEDAGSAMLADAHRRAREPFDLAAGPPLRCWLWRGVPGGDRLLVLVHHITIDGWSVAPLLEDLEEAYQAALTGRTPALRRLPVQYADFAQWDRDTFATPTARQLTERRVSELLALDAELVLAGARRRPSRPQGDRPGRQHSVALSDGLWSRLTEVARSLRVTPFVVLLAAFEQVLWRWSGRTDFVVGAVMANRPHPDLEAMIGYFVSTVPLRCQVQADWSFAELCASTRSEAFRALTYQRIPYDELAAAAAVRAADGHDRVLVNVGFALQNMPVADIASPRWAPPELLFTGTAKFDLLLIVEQRDQGPVCVLEHDTDRYPAEFADRLLADFLDGLSAGLREPESPLHPDTDRPRPSRPTHRSARNGDAGPAAGPAKPGPVAEPIAKEHARATELFVAALAEVRPDPPEVWSAQLTPESNFFALGGNSMLAVSMLARARRGHGVSASPREFLAEPTIANLARLLRAGDMPQPDPGPVRERCPASPAQQRFWTIDRIPSLRTSYVVPALLRLDGPVDRDALVRATDLVLARHPALRSRFELDRAARQVFYRTDGPPPTTTPIDTIGWDEQAMERYLWSGFDLAAGPVARAAVVSRGERTLLVLVVHHIVTDGWSQRVLLDEIAAAYRATAAGRPVQLPEAGHPALSASPPDHVVSDWTQASITRLLGAPTDVALPHDRPRPDAGCTQGASTGVVVDAAVTRGLRAAAASLSCSTFMVVGALLAATLARRSEQRDFLFTFPWADRDSADRADVVGLFVDTLLLRVDLRGGPTWRSLLVRVRDSSTAAYRAADVPFDRLVAALHPDRDLSRPAVTPVYLTVQDAVPEPPDFGPGVRACLLPPEPLHVKYELELTAIDQPETLRLDIAYAVELFDRATVDELTRQLVAAAVDLVTDLDAHPLGVSK
jgi:non-ribosomal peptide synthetase component F